jgi:L-ascorbate metabolism protein UlaG (beta-lactamase superfamily)
MPDLAATQGWVEMAQLPVSGWGTSLGRGHLDPDRAADAVGRLAPRLSVPVHWGTLLPLSYRRLRPHTVQLLHLPPVKFAAAVRARHAETTVIVADPGRPVRIVP